MEINTGIYWTLYPDKQIDPHTAHLINNIFEIKTGEHKTKYESIDILPIIDDCLQKNNVPKDLSELINEYTGQYLKCCECGQYVDKPDNLYSIGKNNYWNRDICNWIFHKRTNQIRCYYKYYDSWRSDWLQNIIYEILKPNGYVLNGIYESDYKDYEFRYNANKFLGIYIPKSYSNPTVVEIKDNYITQIGYYWWSYDKKRSRCFIEPDAKYREKYQKFRTDKRGRRKK